MNTLIVYDTHHGCTEKYIQILAKELSGDIQIHHLKNKSKSNIESFDTIIIGGSIHAGKIQGSVKKFCSKYQKILIQKKLGLFICCMEENGKAINQFEDNYPHALRHHASAKGIFAGELNFDSMNALEKFIIKKIAKTEKSISKFSEKPAIQFIHDLTSN